MSTRLVFYIRRDEKLFPSLSFNMRFNVLSGPEVVKLFFMLKSTEHEISPAHKC